MRAEGRRARELLRGRATGAGAPARAFAVGDGDEHVRGGQQDQRGGTHRTQAALPTAPHRGGAGSRRQEIHIGHRREERSAAPRPIGRGGRQAQEPLPGDSCAWSWPGWSRQLIRTIFQSWSSRLAVPHWTTAAPLAVEDWATPATRVLFTFRSL